MAQAATLEERVARLEGRLEEPSRIFTLSATKDDIAGLRENMAGLKEDMVRLETRIDRLFYLILGSWITLALFIGGLYFR